MFNSMAEAPAKHVAQIAAAFARKTSQGALREMAKCPQNDAEKAMQKVLVKFDLTLDVPLTYVDVGGTEIPCLMPTDYIETLNAKGYLHRMVGCQLDSCPLGPNACSTFLLQCGLRVL